jgi:hypothetical protein
MRVKEQKRQLANSFARSIGFRSLKDTKTVIRKSNLYSGLAFLKKFRSSFIKLFRGRLKKRLQQQLHVNDVIKIFRSVIRDPAICSAVHSTKINVKNPFTGVRTSGYEYRLLV